MEGGCRCAFPNILVMEHAEILRFYHADFWLSVCGTVSAVYYLASIMYAVWSVSALGGLVLL